MRDPNTVVGWDTETELISAEHRYPPIVSLQITTATNNYLWSVADADLDATIESMLSSDGLYVAHNLSFDLMVLMKRGQAIGKDWTPAIFELFDTGRVTDTLIREKLLNVTTHGGIDLAPNKDGSYYKLDYKLLALSKKYLGKDRTNDKAMNDSWRTNYVNLKHRPAAQWPQDAVQYAVDDSMDARAIYFLQEQRRQDIMREHGFDPFATERFNCAVDFSLALTTDRGMEVDPVAKAEIEAMLAQELTPEKLNLLIEKGILRPAQPPRPMKRRKPDEFGNVPMTKEVPESISEKALESYVIDWANRVNAANPGMVKLKRTKPTEKFPEGNLQINKEFLETYAFMDPTLSQYQHRELLQKLVTTYIPAMNTKDEKGEPTKVSAKYIYPNFNPLVESGRTSSYASKLYPSTNGQNVDPRVRGCIIPHSEGHDGKPLVLFSVDISGMELCTLAEKCYQLFGFSVMRDKINAGIDTHAYLGAQLAYHLDNDFQNQCREYNIIDPQTIYEAFAGMNKCGVEAAQKKFDHYRKFAKPTGLGYPGGLGAVTFCAYAKATYKLTVDVALAKTLKDIWLATYPEMVEYFKYINRECIDPVNSARDEETGEEQKLYHYTTPMGFHRAGCYFCPCANGIGLQSPSAEGAKTGHFNVVRACYDRSLNSILYGAVFPNAFIHDEVFGEIVYDENTTLRIKEIQRIIEQSFGPITPNVKMRTEAALMYRWNKEAKSVYDAAGNLVVWEPKPKQEAAKAAA